MTATAQSVRKRRRTVRVTRLPRMTFEEFLDWLDEDTHAEWVNGEVVMHSPVSARHQEVGGLLLCILGIFVEDHQGGEVCTAPF